MKLLIFLLLSSPGKACGPDDISPRVIKESIYFIVQPLCNIYNMSFTTGIVPNKLKIAKIVPLFKKNNPEYFENYRPVALISILQSCLKNWCIIDYMIF